MKTETQRTKIYGTQIILRKFLVIRAYIKNQHKLKKIDLNLHLKTLEK